MAALYKTEVDRRPGQTGNEGQILHGPFFNIAGKRELAAAAINDVIYLAQVPGNSRVDGIFVKHDALGVTNGLTFKMINAGDGTDIATLKTIADVSSAGSAIGLDVDTFILTEDAYMVALKTGAGTATGTVGGWIEYEYIGNL